MSLLGHSVAALGPELPEDAVVPAPSTGMPSLQLPPAATFGTLDFSVIAPGSNIGTQSSI